MAAKRSKSGKKGKARKKGAAPSVMGFLKRVGGMPQAGDTPAKGLLGEISEEDLREAGRLSTAEAEAADQVAPAAVDVAVSPFAKRITVEAQLGEPPGRYEHLEDLAVAGTETGARLNRARSLGVPPERSVRERRHDRSPAELRVEYRNAGRVEVELTADISEHGAFVATPTPLEVGDPLLLTFSLAGERFPLQLAARVKWVTPFGTIEHARPGMGVEFIALNERKRTALQKLVNGAVTDGGS